MAGAGINENIEVLRRTYLQLFSSILTKKNNLDTDQKRQIYKNLQSYLYQKVLKPDEFSNHIPDYAKILSVPDRALSDYLAANFQRALAFVKGKDKPQAAVSPAEAGGSKGQTITSSETVLGTSKVAEFIHELVHFSGIEISPGSRFVPVELGVLKLTGPGTEEIGKSAEGLIKYQPSQAEEIPAEEKSSKPEIIKRTIPSRSEKKQSVLEKEQSIIEEMLNRFGNVLEIHGKLTPASGPEMQAGPVLYEEAPSEEKSSGPEIIKRTIPARSEKKQAVLEQERSIIEELMNRFGNTIEIPGKLEVSSGPPLTGSEIPDLIEAPPVPEFVPIVNSFQIYYGVIKKIRDYQSKNDRNGYNNWLMHADNVTRAVVGIRNAGLKYKKGLIFTLDEDYKQIQRQLGYSIPELEDLKEKIDQFENIQRLLLQLMEDAKTQGKVFINSFRPVWGDIQLIFDSPDTLPKTQFALKKVLKKVQSPAMRTAMEEIVVPHLKSAAKIYMMDK